MKAKTIFGDKLVISLVTEFIKCKKVEDEKTAAGSNEWIEAQQRKNRGRKYLKYPRMASIHLKIKRNKENQGYLQKNRADGKIHPCIVDNPLKRKHCT